ncbi:MAG: N-6 DNA methylase [Legionella sp.]|jgi:type I restriction enzyme M protein
MSINKHFQTVNIHDDPWLLLNSLRDSGLVIDEMLVWLVTLSVIAKENQKNFSELCNIKYENQKKFLFDIIKKSEFLGESELSHRLISSDQFISPDALANLVTYINNVTDFNKLADDLICAFQKSALRGLEHSITDQVIVEIVKGIIGDAGELTIYDGAAGLCSLSSQMTTKKLVLEDINSKTIFIGKCILFLKDINAEYTLANSLTSQKKSVNADLVVTQAPWGVRFTPKDIEKIKESKYIQLKDKMEIPTSANDSLWIQHSIYHLNPNGRAIMLMPQGWLFRGGYDAELRNYLLGSDLIEAVIGLPPGLLKSTMIPTVLLIFNKNKTNKNIVHFFDASHFGSEKKRQLQLSKDEINLIANSVSGLVSESPYYRAVPISEIKENNNQLSINHYFSCEVIWKKYDLKHETKLLEKAQQNFSLANKKLMDLLAN